MKKSNIIALVILAAMAVLLVASVINDSATTDELAHIPAGYGYVNEFDFRLNPEHPPLLKVLSGLSTKIFVNPHFPTDTEYWREHVNGQWDQGRVFLYESGNAADKIIFFSRLPLILLALIFGWVLFVWVRRRFGVAPALSTLTLFAFSPTFLAHSRYVTTDLGAAFGFFIGIAAFLAFLESSSRKNILCLGLALATALLIKYSLILLFPMYALMLIAWVVVKQGLGFRLKAYLLLRLIGKSALAGIVALILIWVVYALFTANYPQVKQLEDSRRILASFPNPILADLNLKMIGNPLTRSLGHYVLGFLMVSQRASGGNTGYFLGEVSAAGSKIYFPLLYLLKEPLTLHILTLIALVFAVRKTFFSHLALSWRRISEWIGSHFAEFSAFIMISIYWLSSVSSPLNIGVRHVLPTFPFIYFLVSRQIIEWLHTSRVADPKTWAGLLSNIYRIYVKAIPRYFVFAVLLAWLMISTINAFPHFLSYYNEFGGGVKKGYTIAVDSNYDWGQDLKRLKRFVDERGIEKIAVDYFGGGSPHYYLGEKFEPWWSARGPVSGWFAISATFLQGAFGEPVPGFERKPEDSYLWLRGQEPIARAGTSIFIYNLP